jgi:hypothetical protein
MWWLLLIPLGLIVAKNMNKCTQGNQYNNQNQAVGTRVVSGVGYNAKITAAPFGPCTVAKAGQCLQKTTSVQSANPKTPTVCSPPNAGRTPVPTGIFILDSSLNRVSGVVEIATGDCYSIQFYSTAKKLLGQVAAVPNGVTTFNYSPFDTVERAVLIGPGGSTIVMNNPATWVQPGICTQAIVSTCGQAFQDKNTCMVGALDQSVPCSGFSTIGSSGVPRVN